MVLEDRLPARIQDLIGKLPIKPERTDSLKEQMADLRWIAMRFGMFDAARKINEEYGDD